MISRLPLFTALVVATAVAGCVAAANEPADGEVEAEGLSSPCGVVVTKNTTDNDYCGFITVKNNGGSPAAHWSVDATLPFWQDEGRRMNASKQGREELERQFARDRDRFEREHGGGAWTESNSKAPSP